MDKYRELIETHCAGSVRDLLVGTETQVRARCPNCSDDRRKKRERTLSLTRKKDAVLAFCHHCNATATILSDRAPLQLSSRRRQSVTIPTTALGDREFIWLEERGIDATTASKFDLVGGRKFLQGVGEADVIGFRYAQDTIKWRSLNGVKAFSQDGSATSLWGVNRFKKGDDILITEGEMDALSFGAAGIPNLCPVSVPSGAPNPSETESTRRYIFLEVARGVLKEANRIIIATDNDVPGHALAQQIVKRIDRPCHRVVWPDGVKDANELLVRDGTNGIVDLMDQVETWPVEGVIPASAYRDEVMDVYDNGLPRGKAAGVVSLDRHYSVAPGMMSVITGIPGSGKTTWVSWLLYTLARNHDMKFAMFSPEFPPKLQIASLATLSTHKLINSSINQMSRDELDKSLLWISKHFTFLDDTDCSLDSILSRCGKISDSIDGLVIDPYNYISLSGEEIQTIAINKMLVRLKQAAVDMGIHVFIVAHPQKMYREGGKIPVPKGYDISHSASWFQVADFGLSLDAMPDCMDGVSDVVVWKCRYGWMGKTGTARLEFDELIGEYSEPGSSLQAAIDDVSSDISDDDLSLDDSF